jgi:hypothetical protein
MPAPGTKRTCRHSGVMSAHWRIADKICPYRTCPLMCRFSAAGKTNLSKRRDGRRPKSAKARNRGMHAPLGGPHAELWGFERGGAAM